MATVSGDILFSRDNLRVDTDSVNASNVTQPGIGNGTENLNLTNFVSGNLEAADTVDDAGLGIPADIQNGLQSLIAVLGLGAAVQDYLKLEIDEVDTYGFGDGSDAYLYYFYNNSGELYDLEEYTWEYTSGGEEGHGGGSICFLKGTPVLTDQGEINIENITSKNSINNKSVNKLVKVNNKDNYVIEVRKNALGKNIPSKTTYMTKEHGIFINGKLVKAKNLVNDETIVIKEMGKHKIYNVLLNKHDKMMVNNMIVETLNPKDNPFK